MPSGNPAAVVSASRHARGKAKTLGTRLLDDDGAAPGNAAATGAATSSTNQMAAVQQQIEGVRAQMQDNVNIMVDNIEKGSNLESRSMELATQAEAFQRTARRTSRHMWWQNFKWKLFIGAGLLVFLLIVLASAGVFNGGGDETKGTDSTPP